METSVRRAARRRIGGNMVQAGGAVAPDGAVGHGLAAGNGGGIFEVEEDVGFGRSVKGFGVPS